MNPTARKILAAAVSVASNTVLIVLKIVVGLLIGSVSVISEAIHSTMDLMAAVIALVAVREGAKPADDKHPFGHGKFENISGTVEALLIFVAAIWIIYEAVKKFLNPAEIESPGWGVMVMAFSAGVNTLVSRHLSKVGHETDSAALQADGWHLRTDVWTSLGVMVGLGLIYLGDFIIVRLNIPQDVKVRWQDHLHLIDPIAAILVAALIVRAAWTLTIRSARDLVDVNLPPEEEQWIRGVLREYPLVHGFHRMRTRKAGPQRFVEFHIFVDAAMTVKESHYLSHKIAKIIQQHFGDASVTVHVEPCGGNCDRPEEHRGA
jgi:divalent metal cation (Fe/Co/Zn/Cd) transporter